MIRAVKEAGYDVPAQPTTIKIGGMTCASCVSHVEKALLGIPEILSVKVNLATETATFSTLDSGIKHTDLQQAISKAGYTIISESEDEGSFNTPFPKGKNQWPDGYSSKPS